MIIIFIIVLTFSWFEQKVTSNHLEYSAGEGPNIGRSVIISSNNYFRGPILPCLDLRSEMMMSPASVTHVTDLDHYLLVNLSASLVVHLFIILSFHLLECLTIFVSSNFIIRFLNFIFFFHFVLLIITFLGLNIDVNFSDLLVDLIVVC